MQFRILGPLEVAERDAPLSLGGAKQRAVLAILLLHRGEVISSERLIDELWGERPPATAAKTLQGYVFHLRRALGDGLLHTRRAGYQLELAPDQLDADEFERLAAEGRAALNDGDPAAAARYLRGALELWRGPPLAEFAYESFAQAEIASLQEARLAALEDRIDADLALGRHEQLVGELDGLVREFPLRERLRAQLMLALYRSGRQVESLAVYRDARETLVGELGLEPGRSLQQLEQAILRQDPELGPSARRPPRPRAPRRAALLIGVGGLLLACAAAATVLELARGPSNATGVVAAERVGVIDPVTGAVVASISVPGAPSRLAADGRELWVGGDVSQTLLQIDPRTRSPKTVLAADGFPSDLAMGAGALWMVDALRGVVVKVNPAYGAVEARTALPAAAREVAIPDRTAFDPWSVAAGASGVWVTDGSARLYRIDPHSAQVTRTIDLGSQLDGVAAAGNELWAISGPAASAVQLDPDTGVATARIPIASSPGLESPYPIAIALGAGFVWVLNANSGTVTKIDPAVRGVAATIAVGIVRGPVRLAAGLGAAWVASADGTLSRIDASSDAVTTFPVAAGLTDVAVAAGHVWVTPGAGPGTGPGPPERAPAGSPVQALPSSSCAPVVSQAGQRPRYLIASDLPLQGAARAGTLEMTDAIRFVLQRNHFRAGRFLVGYQACDNSLISPRGPPNEGARCAPNARAFAEDASVIAVIGPFFSDCTAIEIPIANRAPAGPLAMIAPAATAVGQPNAGPGAGPGEPDRYYPTGRRNFARVIPADNVQGAANAMLAKALGAGRPYVLDDGELYGTGVAASFRHAAARLGLRIAGAAHWEYPAPSYRSLVGKVRRSGATSVFLGGYVADGGALVIQALRAGLPARVKILAPDGFSSGVSAAAGPSAEGVTFSVPGIPITKLPPAGRRFLSQFSTSLINPAQTYSVYAAQATQLTLDAIARSDGTRASVTRKLLTAKVHNGILGNFAINQNGDTTADTIAIYQIRNDTPVLFRVITPPATLLGP